MELIRSGRQLHACWPSLSLWAKLKVILAVRSYLRQLRQIEDVHSSTPGPLSPQPSRCKGLQFGLDSKGPFPSTSALAEHFHGELRRAEARYFRGRKSLDESIFACLVFTHNDLNMRNILLDDEGRLWLVDWGWSGFFPTGFEYLAMRFAAQKDRELKGWQTSIKFMAEPSFEMERWLVGVGYDYADL
jgi:thiamine kinase-like enzyme